MRVQYVSCELHRFLVQREDSSELGANKAGKCFVHHINREYVNCLPAQTTYEYLVLGVFATKIPKYLSDF